MEKNVLRRVSCIYPGKINLPINKIYQISEDENSSIDFYLSKQFSGLNIVDYQNVLSDLDKGKRFLINANYEPHKDAFLMKANRGENLVAMFELSKPGKDQFQNIKRFYYNSFYTEIVLIHYYYNLKQNQKGIVEIEFNEELYNDTLRKIIDFYRLSSADYSIDINASLTTPLYFESYDLYFDNDVPKNEVHQLILKKKDTYCDSFTGQLLSDDFIGRQNIDIKINPEVTDNNIDNLFKNTPHNDIRMVSALSKAQREIMFNKNYKYALLECFTFCETYVTQFLTDCKIKAGVSKAKIETFEVEISISYKLNVELPIFLEITDKIREIISNVDRIRKKRNKIIHSAKDEEVVTKDEAIDALYAVYDLYKVISSKWIKN